MNKYPNHRNEINQLFNAPQHRRLKYAALTVIGIVIALQIVMIIWIDEIPDRTILIMRGCAGVGAIIFVVLVTIIAFRVYSEYFKTRWDRHDRRK